MSSQYDAPTSRTRPVLATGQAVGGKTATGIARFVSSTNDLAAFQAGDILLAEFTAPEWLSAMERAAAIVTNRGGRTCHAAVTARKLGVPAVVGTIDGASRLWNGAMVTVSCAEGDVGRVYEVGSAFD
jgi:pyruvate,water dikinase